MGEANGPSASTPPRRLPQAVAPPSAREATKKLVDGGPVMVTPPRSTGPEKVPVMTMAPEAEAAAFSSQSMPGPPKDRLHQQRPRHEAGNPSQSSSSGVAQSSIPGSTWPVQGPNPEPSEAQVESPGR